MPKNTKKRKGKQNKSARRRNIFSAIVGTVLLSLVLVGLIFLHTTLRDSDNAGNTAITTNFYFITTDGGWNYETRTLSVIEPYTSVVEEVLQQLIAGPLGVGMLHTVPPNIITGANLRINGNWILEIRGDRIYDTYGNWLGSQY